MVQAPFEILADPDRALIAVTLRGFWTAEIFAAYCAEIVRAEERMTAAGKRFDYLCDASAFQVQARETAELFMAFLSQPGPNVRRIAGIVPNALLRMQGARVLSNDRQRLFGTREEATAWLRSDGAAAKAA